MCVFAGSVSCWARIQDWGCANSSGGGRKIRPVADACAALLNQIRSFPVTWMWTTPLPTIGTVAANIARLWQTVNTNTLSNSRDCPFPSFFLLCRAGQCLAADHP